MATILHWTADQLREYAEWVSSRPAKVQAMIRKWPPDKLYRLTTSGHRVRINSYLDDGTVVVLIDGRYNAVMFDRMVHGVRPENLVECDLPKPGEVVGTALTDPEAVRNFIKPLIHTEN